MNVVEISFRHDGNTLEFPAELTAEHFFGLSVAERPDHTRMLLLCGRLMQSSKARSAVRRGRVSLSEGCLTVAGTLVQF